MSQANSDQVFSQMRDNERQQIQFKAFRAGFVRVIEKVLDEYGLAARLQTAIAESRKLRLLQIGCGEGFYIQELAAQLESRNLLAGADLTGLDSNPAAIAVAHEYSRLSKPPRAYLNFLVHDEKKPLTESFGLRRNGELKFDFIFVIQILEHLQPFQEYLKSFYDLLSPGGVFYSRDVVLHEGPDGWYNPYPSVGKLLHSVFGLLLKQSNGVEVSQELPGWLEDLDAAQIQSWPLKMTNDTTTEEGRNFLRQSIMAVYNARPILLNLKLLTAQEFDQAIEAFYREATPDKISFTTYVDTLAWRPATGE